MKSDSSIIIKEADKGSEATVWDREDHLKEVKNQLNGKNVYKKLAGDVEGSLEKIIKLSSKNSEIGEILATPH